MTDQFQPQTTYVTERLRATSWDERQTIRDLLDLEALYQRRWGNGLHLLQLNMLARRRRIEALIIRTEIKSGRRLSEAEAQTILDEQDRQQRDQAAAQEQREALERQERARIEQEAWIKAGGRP